MICETSKKVFHPKKDTDGFAGGYCPSLKMWVRTKRFMQ